MVSRFKLSALAFLVAFGNGLHPVSGHGASSCSLIERVEENDLACIDSANDDDLFDQDSLYLVEENASGGNEEGNDNGNVFGLNDGSQCGCVARFAHVFRLAHRFAPSISFARDAGPLYLLNRVFRI